MKKRKQLFYYLWTGAIFLSLILVLFSLVFASCSGPAGAAEPDETPPASAGPGESVAPGESTAPGESAAPSTDPPEPTFVITTDNVELQETEDYGQEYIDKFVFLGDSTTYGLDAYDIVDSTQVWTPANRTFSLFNQSFIRILYPETGEELTIPEILSRKQPEYLMITLGVNGISSMDEDYFKSEYLSLISTIRSASPDTKIIVNTMYPLCASYDTSSGVTMDKIRAGNEWLKELAAEAGVRFLNTFSALVGDDGYMPEEYTNGDGLHLNPSSFGIVINYIRTHGYQ